jgi:hypothetical protein
MELLEIRRLKNVKSICILMRHAERFEIENMKNHMNAMLTEKGKKDARLLGETIAGVFDSADIYHSEIKRCAQTAEFVAVGMRTHGKECNVKGKQYWLGVDIINGNSEVLDAYINKHGIDSFYRQWFKNGFTKDIINSYAEIAETKFKEIMRQLIKSSGLTINVTHDWNLMVILMRYLNLYTEKINIPGYLDQIIFTLEENRIVLRYGNYCHTIPDNA